MRPRHYILQTVACPVKGEVEQSPYISYEGGVLQSPLLSFYEKGHFSLSVDITRIKTADKIA